MSVSVIGCDGDRLPSGAADALAEAALVVGPADVLARHAPVGATTTSDPEELNAHRGTAAILSTGDPGFFGELRALRAKGLRPSVLPAPSDPQRLFARFALSWDTVAVVDTRAGDGARRAINLCRSRRAVAVVTGHGAGPAELGAGLLGRSRTLIVAEDLGGRRERISVVTPEEAATKWWREPNLVICLADPAEVPARGWYGGGDPAPAPGWALPADEFAHRAGDLYPESVRAVVLARLAPRPGDMIWDVGAGAGAVAVDSARLGAAVIAVERDPVQCVRISANATAHGVECQVVEGEAPVALRRLPRPDAIFVGCGGPDMVSYCARAKADRVVIAIGDPTHLGRMREALRSAGYTVGGCHLSPSRYVDLPDGTARLAAEDPVLILWGQVGA